MIMPKCSYMTSFRYSAGKTRDACLEFFASLASRCEMTLVERTSCLHPGIPKENLAEIEKSCWRTSDYEKLKAEGLIPMSEVKAQQFMRSYNVDSYTYKTEGGEWVMVVKAADDNLYPCIGEWTWMDDDLKFSGGVVEIAVPDEITLKRMMDEIRSFSTVDSSEPQKEPAYRERMRELEVGGICTTTK